MDTILTVENEHLALLSSVKAVELFRELLWVEATRIGVPLTHINVSNWVDVPDGGVDASVHTDNVPKEESFIRKGHNSYQIKTGRHFSPWRKSAIKKELFGKKSPGKQNLGDKFSYLMVGQVHKVFTFRTKDKNCLILRKKRRMRTSGGGLMRMWQS